MIETVVVRLPTPIRPYQPHSDVDCCLVLEDGILTAAITDIGGGFVDMRQYVPSPILFAIWTRQQKGVKQ